MSKTINIEIIIIFNIQFVSSFQNQFYLSATNYLNFSILDSQNCLFEFIFKFQSSNFFKVENSILLLFQIKF